MNTRLAPCTGQGAEETWLCTGYSRPPEASDLYRGGLETRHCVALSQKKGQEQKLTEISLQSPSTSCTPSPLRTWLLMPPEPSHCLPSPASHGLPPAPTAKPAPSKTPGFFPPSPAPVSPLNCSASLHLLTTLFGRLCFPPYPWLCPPQPSHDGRGGSPPHTDCFVDFSLHGPSIAETQNMTWVLLKP